MEIAQLIADITERLKTVPGVEAVVLGGSRARGTHTEKSDIDLGIYYRPSAPLDLTELARVATEVDDEHRPNLVTAIGGWGPWINGGGWLTVDGLPVDFLYRDLDKVDRIISDCLDGHIEVIYQAGHPLGFVSAIYLAEVALCRPLWDPHETVASLKSRVQPYPPRLKQAIIDSFWWEAEFSLGIAHKSISRGDVVYAAGCCFRCVGCMLQTLFAINEEYWMNEKGAVAIAAGFPILPHNFGERVEWAFERLNENGEAIADALDTLRPLLDECGKLVEEARA
jgi:predicted nucleotidyltransferase